jgi:hypothetical protein
VSESRTEPLVQRDSGGLSSFDDRPPLRNIRPAVSAKWLMQRFNSVDLQAMNQRPEVLIQQPPHPR